MPRIDCFISQILHILHTMQRHYSDNILHTRFFISDKLSSSITWIINHYQTDYQALSDKLSSSITRIIKHYQTDFQALSDKLQAVTHGLSSKYQTNYQAVSQGLSIIIRRIIKHYQTDFQALSDKLSSSNTWIIK